MTSNNTSSDNLITFTINGIEDVKGQNITILDLREIENTVCDYFIICDGNLKHSGKCNCKLGTKKS